MAKVILPYTADNKLSKLIQQKVDQEKKRVKDIEQELAAFCGITQDAIRSYKFVATIPSLPIALKIATYFNTKVEDIFSLVEN